MSRIASALHVSVIAETPEAALPTTHAREAATPEKRDSRGRLGGIDSIRALAACVVVLGHQSLFPETAVHSSHVIFRTLARISAASWNGPASVIVFFVISGLCIHLPFRGSRPLHPVSFLLRRAFRIGIPAIAALLLTTYVLKNPSGLGGVIWSIICEAIYYLLYPALLPLGRRFGWLSLIGVSYIASFTLAFTHLHQLSAGFNGYDALGHSLTWLIGLPCWLLGCWLAENEKHFPALTKSQIWLLRVGIFLVMVVLRIVKFHAHTPLASNCLTLNVFAILACIWLGLEIAYFKQTQVPRFLEWMGEWSYSLYLIHPLSIGVFALLGLSALARSGNEILHLLTVGSAFLMAYVFHLLFERPSHRLAIIVSRPFNK
jgi:peptidoglycan/LPS O-acetylase OafA/YrhL